MIAPRQETRRPAAVGAVCSTGASGVDALEDDRTPAAIDPQEVGAGNPP